MEAEVLIMAYRTPFDLAPTYPCDLTAHHPPFIHPALALPTAVPGVYPVHSHLEDFLLVVPSTWNALFPGISMACFLTSHKSLSNVTTFSERPFLTTLSEAAHFIVPCVLNLT